MEKQYDSFVFYDSFYNAISLLPLESQARVYNAIFKFALTNEEPELEGAELAIYLLIKPQILANRERRENACKGGAPKCNQNAKKKTTEDNVENNQKQLEDNFSVEKNNSKQPLVENNDAIKTTQNNQKQPLVENFAKKNNQKQPNVNVNVNVNDNVNVNANVNENVNVNDNGSSITTRKRFVRPTLDEVKQYCVERHNSVDAQRFMDFYASKGWLVGNQPMKDWKAAVRTWEQRENNPSGGAKVAIASKYDRED